MLAVFVGGVGYAHAVYTIFFSLGAVAFKLLS